MSGKRQSGLALALVASVALTKTVPARAVDLSLQLQPGYNNATLHSKDETGQEHRTESSTWLQKYRLSLDAPIYPQLVLNAGGVLDWNNGTARTDGVDSSFDSKRWNGFAHLRLGSAMVSGGLDYDRRDESSKTTVAGVRSSSPRFVSESYGASVSWRPVDLPSLDLALHRQDAYDWTRKLVDRTSDDALLSTRYKPVSEVDLGLAIRAGQTENHLTQQRTRDLTQSLLASYADSYLAGRAAAYVAYNASARVSTTSVGKIGGTVPTLQLPAAGLSIVEIFPAIATQVTLNPNAALIDGNLTTSAGLNLGFSASAGGQRQYRDIGAQFTNVITPVNAVYVWVDRQIPDDVASSFQWEAYRSDDNVNWTPITITGAVVFGILENRFEISIERTEARYLKVVTRPLVSTLTTDPQLSEIFVTEAQFLLVVPAEEARGRSSSFGGSLNANGRLSLVPSINLAYDVSSLITHSDTGSVTWAISNGLTASRRLNPVFRVSGRVDRTDTDSGLGHESSNRWGGSLSIEPLTTLGGLVSYGGQFSQSRGGNALTQTLALLGRADLYEGIALSATGTQGLGFNEAHQTVQSTTGSAGLSLVPNRFFSANGNASYTGSSQRGGDAPDRTDRRVALDAAATLSPFPALALAGGVSRFLAKNLPPQTLANFSASLSPFPGGALSIRYAYLETLDTAADQRTRVHGPSLRWNIRAGWFFDSGYSFQETHAPAEQTSGRAFNANLTITLR
jgi:hypothetical protein